MPDVQEIAKTTLEEIEKLLTSKTVVGEAIVVGENTIIPLVSVGFGFGAGSGVDKTPGKGEGGGTGGGGGIKPVAVIVISDQGVRIEPIKRGAATPVLEKVVETIGRMRDKRDKEGEKASA